MIQVRSVKVGEDEWDRPTSVTVRDCRIIGSVRTYGMSTNREGADVKESSHNKDSHVTDVRSAAPTGIRYIGLDVEGVGRTPFCVAPGVTFVALEDSRLHGWADSVGLYLDAESAFNRIVENTIEVDTKEVTIAGITGAPHIAEGTIMGSRCLRAGGEFLAMPDHRTGGLVVKLPRERVQELIGAGIGAAFAPAGKVFEEWFAVVEPDEERRRVLLAEGKAFVAG